MQRCDVASQCWLLLYPVPGYTSRWWRGCALSEDGSALDHSLFFSFFQYESEASSSLCMCAYLFFASLPATCLKLLSANIPILPSLHHFPSFPLLSHFVHFPLTALSCLSVVPWLLRERLHSSSPLINSLLSQSLLVFLFFLFFLKCSHLPSPPLLLSLAAHQFGVLHSPISHSSAAQQLTCSV